MLRCLRNLHHLRQHEPASHQKPALCHRHAGGLHCARYHADDLRRPGPRGWERSPTDREAPSHWRTVSGTPSGLSGIGFLAQSGSSARTYSYPAFLIPFAFALAEVRRLWDLAGCCDGLRPRFSYEPAARQDFCFEEGGHYPQASTHHTTQPAFRWLTRRPLARRQAICCADSASPWWASVLVSASTMGACCSWLPASRRRSPGSI